jgi:rhamnosyltransferase
MKKPEISIIIRSYNEEKDIGKCLNVIFKQKIESPFEVLIVDSESNDETREIASKFPVKIIKIKKENFSYGEALNVGAKAAKGKYLVFLSAHAIPVNEKWLKNLIKNFKSQKIVGIFGKQIPKRECSPLTKRQIIEHWEKEKNIKSMRYFFSNTNSAIRKSIWLKIKFNKELSIAEDHAWAKKVINSGYLIAYEPTAIVYHSHNKTLLQLFIRHYNEVYSSLLIYDKKIIFRYLADPFYNFFRDFQYILKNKYSKYWIIKSLVNNSLLFIAVVLSFLK